MYLVLPFPSTTDCTFNWNTWTECDKQVGSQTRDLTITTLCYPTNCANGFLEVLDASKCPSPETRICDVACEFVWPDWGACNKNTGKQQRSPAVSVNALNAGQACPSQDERECDIDCEFNWDPWSTCNPTTGKQFRKPSISVTNLNNGVACPTEEDRDCPVDCVHTWKEWGTCDASTGKQFRDPVISVPTLNKGVACPTQEDRDCPVDCVHTWKDWETCDPKTGKQVRDPIVSVVALNAGVACPTQEERDCSVDCKYTWSDWGTCGILADGTASKGKHERTVIIETPCYPLNNCAPGHLLTGTPCPEKQQKTCMVDCESTFREWSVCDDTSGKQSREVTVTTPPFGGGAPCLTREERPCKVDCVIQWNEWSSCDKKRGVQNRDHHITMYPKNGFGGQPKPCPPFESKACTVDCEGYWGQWSTCTSPSGNYPPFTRLRSYVITIPMLNGGQQCAPAEKEPCLPDVCYSADVEASGRPAFGAKKMGMRPLRTLPPGHPAFARTNCGGPLTATDR